jgi:hypothetical protein
MRREANRRAALQDYSAAQALERERVAEALERLRPIINDMLETMVDDLRAELESLVVAAVAGRPSSRARVGRLGEFKRCRVCGLPGARNLAALPPGHTREEHEQLRVKPPSVTLSSRAFDAQRSTSPRRWQRA